MAAGFDDSLIPEMKRILSIALNVSAEIDASKPRTYDHYEEPNGTFKLLVSNFLVTKDLDVRFL